MRLAQIPQVPKDLNRDLQRFLLAVKESVEVIRGRGGAGDSVVTQDYLKGQGFLTQEDLPKTTSSVIEKNYDVDLEPGSVTSNILSNNSVTTEKIVNGSVTREKLAFKLSTLVLESSWPIGSVFVSVVNTNPATLLGFGTWVAIATDKLVMTAGGTHVGEATGGTVGHTHTLTGPTGGAAPSTNGITGTVEVESGTGTVVASSGHSHTTASHSHTIPTPTANADHIPEWVALYFWKRTT